MTEVMFETSGSTFEIVQIKGAAFFSLVGKEKTEREVTVGDHLYAVEVKQIAARKGVRVTVSKRPPPPPRPEDWRRMPPVYPMMPCSPYSMQMWGW